MGSSESKRYNPASLAITIPCQIAELHDIKEGDYMEFEPIGSGEFKIKKVGKNIKEQNKKLSMGTRKL